MLLDEIVIGAQLTCLAGYPRHLCSDLLHFRDRTKEPIQISTLVCVGSTGSRWLHVDLLGCSCGDVQLHVPRSLRCMLSK